MMPEFIGKEEKVIVRLLRSIKTKTMAGWIPRSLLSHFFDTILINRRKLYSHQLCNNLKFELLILSLKSLTTILS